MVVSHLVGRGGFETRPYAVPVHRRFEPGAGSGPLLRGRPMQNARCRRPIVYSQGLVYPLRAALRLLASHSQSEGDGAAFVHLATPRPSFLASAYLLDVWATRPPRRAGIPCEGRFARSRPLALCEGEGPLCPSDISPAERGQPYPLVAVLQWSHGGERGFCPALPQWLDVQSAGFPRPRE